MPAPDSLAIITGTSTGIGHAIAKQLVDRGWFVVGVSRRPAQFPADRYRHIALDLGDVDRLATLANTDVAALARDTRWRRIGLVNNAASTGSMRALEGVDPGSLTTVYVVNVVAPIVLMGAVVRNAPPGTPLRIVNVSTGAANAPFPGIGEYGSSKAALRLASMTFASELTSPERPGGVRRDAGILSYQPGVVDTEMQVMARSPRPWNSRFVAFHDEGRLVQPEGPASEVADYLESEHPGPFSERRYGTP